MMQWSETFLISLVHDAVETLEIHQRSLCEQLLDRRTALHTLTLFFAGVNRKKTELARSCPPVYNLGSIMNLSLGSSLIVLSVL